MLHSTVL